MALTDYILPDLENRGVNQATPLGQPNQTLTQQAPVQQPLQPTQAAPAQQATPKKSKYLEAAELAMQYGRSDIANSLIAIGKMKRGGEANNQIVDIEDPQNPGKLIKAVVDRNTGNIVKSLGNIPSQDFKFTGASVFRGQDNRWWRWNPSTGNPEFQQGGKWIYDPKVPVPDAVPKELGRTPAASLEKGVQIDTIRGNIARIRNQANDGWIGPVQGRAFAVQEALTGLKDPLQSSFYADVNDLGDMLLRARSGAQINEQEYARLRRLVPTPNLPPKVFKERLNRFETQLVQTIEARQKRLRANRYMSAEPTPMSSDIVTGASQKQTQDYTNMSTEELLRKLNE